MCHELFKRPPEDPRPDSGDSLPVGGYKDIPLTQKKWGA